ncbi:hypothetical protein PP568_06665 [Mycobacteroides abscessus]|uniref:VOC domain-containing protein n=1 Tax=Mycobacteroides abscessus subsp. abscessus TaxID=1185650 RepID=A0AB38D322_9MYCO|nr:VOC family protein [Mycobacteroides abscessus]MBE5419535.1 hypothetical protein [Mycobacteroides abscessus]MBE5455766.1 hypothetical protein [Mycobacteroides abscessus]MBN7463492.1 hypothetical protein [Mycobacteroides abscessus subsp. abscessus]MBN7555220.1 hypothetical protein [Mycobacteroides abscessus subsp. abscessus]MDM2404612.1 hypothetical protein [Mycobacteroides abscessus]
MIRHLSLFYAAADLNRARELFTAALDVEFAAERHLEQTTYLTAELLGGTALELWPAGGRPSRVQLEFEVEDLDVVAERLTDAGFEVRQLSGAVLAVDPAGNTVALISASARQQT